MLFVMLYVCRGEQFGFCFVFELLFMPCRHMKYLKLNDVKMLSKVNVMWIDNVHL